MSDWIKKNIVKYQYRRRHIMFHKKDKIFSFVVPEILGRTALMKSQIFSPKNLWQCFLSDWVSKHIR
jgi:hypothetical protein